MEREQFTIILKRSLLMQERLSQGRDEPKPQVAAAATREVETPELISLQEETDLELDEETDTLVEAQESATPSEADEQEVPSEEKGDEHSDDTTAPIAGLNDLLLQPEHTQYFAQALFDGQQAGYIELINKICGKSNKEEIITSLTNELYYIDVELTDEPASRLIKLIRGYFSGGGQN